VARHNSDRDKELSTPALLQTHDNLLMLPWTELRFNPVKPPPGVLPRRWVQVFNEILGHATALLSGSKNYLLIALLGRSPAGETVRACGASRRCWL